MRIRAAKLARLALPALLGIGLVAAQDNGTKRDDLNTRRQEIEKQRSGIRSKISQGRKQKRTVLGIIQECDRRIDRLTGQIGNANERLRATEVRLRETEADLREAEAALAAGQERLSTRLLTAYEQGTTAQVVYVLDSEDAWDFLTRSHYLEQVMKSDLELLEEIKAQRQKVAQKKQELLEHKDEIAALEAQLVGDREEEQASRGERRQVLNKIDNDLESWLEAERELERESQEIERQIRALMATQAGQERMQNPWTGGYNLPVDGRISSRFGMRMHPILKQERMHNGVDIAAAAGTPIHAAAGGVVIMSGWRDGYGKTVVIDHGGGVSTLYGHCSKLLVEVDDKVEQGDTIALVGSTGLATGPHVHFEKRINGTPVDPLGGR
jgi:murein DD-endopeptidase MepM/ murein hydrolase activator NlpD